MSKDTEEGYRVLLRWIRNYLEKNKEHSPEAKIELVVNELRQWNLEPILEDE